jgi:hypothetical protein
MSGPDNDNPQWHQNQEPGGEGQPPQWNAEGQGQPPPWTGGQEWTPPGPPQAPVMIKNYRTQSIVTLVLSVLFCWFGLATGIPALIYSTRVNESIGRGDYARALDSSRKARLLSWISVGIIAFFWVIIAIIIAVNVSHSTSSNTGTTTTGTTNTGTTNTGTTNTGNTGTTNTGNTGTTNTGNTGTTNTGNTGTTNTGNTGN